MTDTFDAFGEAAGEWLRSGTARTLDRLAALHAFGFPEAMAHASSGERAAMAAATGLAMGRELALGPLVEAVAREVCGLTAQDAPMLAAIDPHQDASASGRAGVVCVPYAEMAKRYLVVRQDSGTTVLACLELDAIVDVERVPQADGTTVALVPGSALARAHEASRGAQAHAGAAELTDLLLLSTSARLTGVGDRCFSVIREHLATRVQFGKTLSSFQALQHAVVDAHIELVLARSLLDRLVEDWSVVSDRRALLLALKAQASTAARSTCRKGVQLLGAMGFTDEGPVGPCLKHALVLAARYGGEARCRATYRENPVDLFG